MSEKTGFNSFHQTFECIHFDSTTCDSRLFPVPPHRHYFSEVMLVRSGAARVPVAAAGSPKEDPACRGAHLHFPAGPAFR